MGRERVEQFAGALYQRGVLTDVAVAIADGAERLSRMFAQRGS